MAIVGTCHASNAHLRDGAVYRHENATMLSGISELSDISMFIAAARYLRAHHVDQCSPIASMIGRARYVLSGSNLWQKVLP